MYLIDCEYLWFMHIFVTLVPTIIFPRTRLTFANDQAVRQKDLGHHLRQEGEVGALCWWLTLGIDVEEYGKIWEKYGENMEKSVENHTGTYMKKYGKSFPNIWRTCINSEESWLGFSMGKVHQKLGIGGEIMLEKNHVVTWCDNNMATIYAFTKKK